MNLLVWIVKKKLGTITRCLPKPSEEHPIEGFKKEYVRCCFDKSFRNGPMVMVHAPDGTTRMYPAKHSPEQVRANIARMRELEKSNHVLHYAEPQWHTEDYLE